MSAPPSAEYFSFPSAVCIVNAFIALTVFTVLQIKAPFLSMILPRLCSSFLIYRTGAFKGNNNRVLFKILRWQKGKGQHNFESQIVK